jgi:hypothetical protein
MTPCVKDQLCKPGGDSNHVLFTKPNRVSSMFFGLIHRRVSRIYDVFFTRFASLEEGYTDAGRTAMLNGEAQ